MSDESKSKYNEQTAAQAQELAEAMRALGEGFIGRIPTMIAAMEKELNLISLDPQDPAPWKLLYRLLHSLAGSSGSFGFSELGDRASELEQRINEILKSDDIAALQGRLEFIRDQRKFMVWMSENHVKKIAG
ncbi:Hpt domain-containing protein [Solimicrobium silvestre]|uniref:Hpt domain n=1 Tax=Solimicrobium silvestre TaxID=2099400 RepID=A0A2S9H1L1_9BURK|nr:Hpt domain-containing protein [Solimicrobium silvestre]PRC93840.1 Hpt domain [Solimicrobium silvestre]